MSDLGEGDSPIRQVGFRHIRDSNCGSLTHSRSRSRKFSGWHFFLQLWHPALCFEPNMSANRFNRIFAPVLLASLFAGCAPKIVNLTPQPMPRNPSGIYTLSMEVRTDDAAIDRESFDARTVIDGEERPMKRSGVGRNVFDYDFVMPSGRQTAKYYFILDYTAEHGETPRRRQVHSDDVYELTLVDRYVIDMPISRGFVGSEIPVVGSGFTRFDTISIGGLETETRIESQNSLTFVVPPLLEGQSYPVELLASNGTQFVGEFFVDPSRMRVSPQQLAMVEGEPSVLLFAIDFPAPEGGLQIDVKTNIPRSVVMPKVRIPEGERSVSVRVEGAQPGDGNLFINTRGFAEIVVPVSVKPAPKPEVTKEAEPEEPAGVDLIIVDEA